MCVRILNTQHTPDNHYTHNLQPGKPMKNVSTPMKTTEAGMSPSSHPSHRCRKEPRKSTILLIRQFARAYTCQAKMPVALAGFVAN